MRLLFNSVAGRKPVLRESTRESTSTGPRPATLLNSKRAREGILASFSEILWASREILSLKMLSMLSMSSSLK